MIKYKLICNDCNIKFDSWFASSNEYDKLKKKNFLTCHSCNSLRIEKTLMAPQLINSNIKSEVKIDTATNKKIKNTIKNYQKFIKDNFQYVGDNFAYEARAIHYNNKKKTKGIYGNATKRDLEDLKDEGIEAQMIPWIEDNNN